MLRTLAFLLASGATLTAAAVGYWQARKFVSNRLRFVDAAHTSTAPIVAGVVAGLIALPVVAILPLVGPFTALLFGLSVGFGVSAGSRDVRRRLGPG